MRDPELVERLIREAVETAEYGLGRDGCPFCGRIDAHNEDCVAKAFGARDYDGDVHPERQLAEAVAELANDSDFVYWMDPKAAKHFS